MLDGKGYVCKDGKIKQRRNSARVGRGPRDLIIQKIRGNGRELGSVRKQTRGRPPLILPTGHFRLSVLPGFQIEDSHSVPFNAPYSTIVGGPLILFYAVAIVVLSIERKPESNMKYLLSYSAALN